jgi:hypothetical protein
MGEGLFVEGSGVNGVVSRARLTVMGTALGNRNCLLGIVIQSEKP